MTEEELNSHYGDDRRDTKEYWERIADGALKRMVLAEEKVRRLEERVNQLNEALSTTELYAEFDNVNKR